MDGLSIIGYDTAHACRSTYAVNGDRKQIAGTSLWALRTILMIDEHSAYRTVIGFRMCNRRYFLSAFG